LLDGYRVTTAATAEQGLVLLRQPHEFDAVLLDVRLPGRKGTDALREIKRLVPGVPVIIFTGYPSKDTAVDALRGNADDFLEKPGGIKKVKDLLERLIRKQWREPGDENVAERVKRFTRRNFNKQLRLEDAADAVALSPKYVSRLFKRETGMGFNQYKLKLRMAAAKRLLAETDQRINHIAYEVGYHNPESFIRIFKKQSGLSPSQYRSAQGGKLRD
jgi:two-component system response regulator YesN